jgi:hypothetical protein
MVESGGSMLLPLSEALICEVRSIRDMQKAAGKMSVDVKGREVGRLGWRDAD